MQKVYFGTSENMSTISDASTQLIITSPPYRQLKDYGKSGQIGFDDDYDYYQQRLFSVRKECFRILEHGSRMVINVGDQFTRASVYGRYKIVPIHADIIVNAEKAGFDFMGQIIWQKATSMNSSGGASIMGSYPYPRNGIVKLDFEYIMIFKKVGKSSKVSIERKEKSKLTKEERNKYFVGHWTFPGAKQGDGHVAIYPEELPRRIIKMFSFVGDTVVDPFLGSGTTLKVTQELGRNGIGYEINDSFLSLIQRKLDGGLFKDTVEYFTVDNQSTNLQKDKSLINNQIRSSIAKQVDPRTKKYGNKVQLEDY